jgi:hypothetical protein
LLLGALIIIETSSSTSPSGILSQFLFEAT